MRVVRDECSLGSAIVSSPGPFKSGPICRADKRNGRDSCVHLWEFRAGPSKSDCASGWTPAGPRVALHEAIDGVRAPASIGCAINEFHSQRAVEMTTLRSRSSTTTRFEASVRHDGGEELGHSSSGSAGHGIAGFVADLVEMITHLLDRQLGTVEPLRPADEESRDVSRAHRVDLAGNGAIPVSQEGRYRSHERWVQFLKVLAHKVIQHNLRRCVVLLAGGR